MIKVFIALLFGMALAKAETHYGLDVTYRSKPAGYNGSIMAAYDGRLWGIPSTSDPLYGYYRVGARIGGSPRAAGFFQIAPVAPLIFEVQKSTTHRFLESTNFNCETSECQGTIDRTDFTFKTGAAYKNFVLLAQATWRDIRTEDSGKNIALELEYFTISPGHHRYQENTVTLGYVLPEDRLVGILYNGGTISEGSRRFDSAYGIYRWKFLDYSAVVGAGHYKSEQPFDEWGIILALSARWGDRLSLF